MGFTKSYITRAKIINTYFQEHNINDVIKMIVNAEHIETEKDEWVTNIVECCLHKDVSEVEEIIKQYIYNK